MRDAKDNVSSYMKTDVQVDSKKQDKVGQECNEMFKGLVPQTPKNDFGKRETDESVSNASLHQWNQEFLLKVLSPQVENNEVIKRKHKTWLITLLTCFLVIQFIVSGAITCKILKYACADYASVQIVNRLLVFASGYVTSVVVELIAILSYIVKNVFDTSLTELVKAFKD